MGKPLKIFVAIVTAFTCLLFAACADNGGGGDVNYTGSLAFEGVYEGGELTSYSVSGIGTFNGTEVLIPANFQGKPVTGVSDRAFYGNEDITYVDMHPSVVSIGDNAFFGCKNLTAIGLSKNLASVGIGAFGACSSLRFNTYSNGNYLGNDENPYLIYVKPVDKAFSYVLHKDAKLIYGQAFDSSVSQITLPDDLTALDGYSFVGCSALRSVTLPESNQKYFYDDGVITDGYNKLILAVGDATVHDKNFTAIAPYAFAASGLEEIVLPSGVKSLNDSAFAYCTAKSVNVGTALESVGEGIFYRADELIKIVDCSNDNYICKDNCIICLKDKAVVAGCVGAVLPYDDNVTSVGKEAFYACGGLKEIVIPENIVKIGDRAFYYCTALKSVAIVGSGLKHVGANAFSLCLSLENIVLPEGVTKIFKGAFSNSALKEITLPSSLQTIEENAFFGCKLDKVIYGGDKNAFSLIAINSGNESLFAAQLIC